MEALLMSGAPLTVNRHVIVGVTVSILATPTELIKCRCHTRDQGSMYFMTQWLVQTSKLKAQVESGNPDYEVIRSIWCETSSLMELIPDNLRVSVKEQVSSNCEEVKNLFLTPINDSQWERIECELAKTRHTLSWIFVLMNYLKLM